MESQLQNHLSQYKEYKTKKSEEMDQLFALVRDYEEKFETMKSENEELLKKNAVLTMTNETLFQRVEDLENETNKIQEKVFNGEIVSHGQDVHQITDRKLQSSQQQCATEDVYAANTQALTQNETSEKYFEQSIL